MSYEEAINPEHMPRRCNQHPAKKSPYMQQWQQKKEYESYIDITLAPEEASVFRSAYNRMLVQLEEQLEDCKADQMAILTTKIKKIKEEIRIFNLFNS